MVNRKGYSIPIAIAAVASIALVAMALMTVHGIKADAYETYCAKGGKSGFWPWLAKGVCGGKSAEVTNKTKTRRLAKEKLKAALQKKLADQEGKAAKQESEKTAEASARPAQSSLIASKPKKQRISRRTDITRLADNDPVHHGKRISTAGMQTVVQGGGGSNGGGSGGARGPEAANEEEEKQPYRVKSIRGIEFGSTNYAPGEDANPLKSVFKNSDGSEEFERLMWCETKELDESIYGFDQVLFRHTLETEELASLTFYKCFPPTEEGMNQAIELYESMSNEASEELGFTINDVDRSDEKYNPTIVGFKSDEGDSYISGRLSARGNKSIQVTLSVVDKPYQQEVINQSDAAYSEGVVDAVESFTEVHSKVDYTANKQQALGYVQ